jgi:SAM-dependent methyltransferase
MAPKFEKYQDYVIKDGKLVGEFEQMYKDFDEPWHQTVREEYSSEKSVGINLILRLKNQSGIQNVVELGCGFGNYTARIHQLGLNVTGLDISQTAIEKWPNLVILKSLKASNPILLLCLRLHGTSLINLKTSNHFLKKNCHILICYTC